MQVIWICSVFCSVCLLHTVTLLNDMLVKHWTLWPLFIHWMQIYFLVNNEFNIFYIFPQICVWQLSPKNVVYSKCQNLLLIFCFAWCALLYSFGTIWYITFSLFYIYSFWMWNFYQDWGQLYRAESFQYCLNLYTYNTTHIDFKTCTCNHTWIMKHHIPFNFIICTSR